MIKLYEVSLRYVMLFVHNSVYLLNIIGQKFMKLYNASYRQNVSLPEF